MTPADFQFHLRQASRGVMSSCELLVRHYVCPSCGRSPLNVSWPAASKPQEVMAACFLCGWTTSYELRLRLIPQCLLAHRQVLVRHADSIKQLVRDSILDGAVVEPGMYRVARDQRTCLRFTQATLKSILSKEEFERIEQMMPCRTENHVTVKFTGSSCTPYYQPLQPFAPFCEMKLAEADRSSTPPSLLRCGPYDAEF